MEYSKDVLSFPTTKKFYVLHMHESFSEMSNDGIQCRIKGR